MTWMIPFTILTICLVASVLLAMSWMRADWRSTLEAYRETNREITRAYDSLTRTLLSVDSVSASQTPTTSQPLERQSWPEPKAEFGRVPIDENLLREYQVFLEHNRTMSGQAPRAHPEVEQIVPGQVRANLTGYGPI